MTQNNVGYSVWTTVPSLDWSLVIITLIIIALTSLGLLFLSWLWYFTRTRYSFRDKVCVVAGASKGIGRAVAERLAEEGVKALLLLDVMDCNLTKTSCEQKGCSQVKVFRCDVTNDGQMKDLSRVDLFSDVYLVVDCAGVVAGKAFDALSVKEFRRVIDVNCVGTYSLAKTFLPPILQRGDGCFVAVSSLMGLMGGARLSDYCASKFGVVGLMEALRMEFTFSHPRVAFVTVCPYAVDTEMFSGIFEATRWTRLIRTIFPIVKTQDAAASIVQASTRGNSVVSVPFYFGPLINLARCLPSPLYEIILFIMGGKDGMLKYRGKSNVWGENDK